MADKYGVLRAPFNQGSEEQGWLDCEGSLEEMLVVFDVLLRQPYASIVLTRRNPRWCNTVLLATESAHTPLWADSAVTFDTKEAA